ncbi:PaaI family thioesterase [Hippea alviniae]|uniref:PaaI family thioesterase n=1 Tax=Hippea alviniae TaxID=1279027 RepID=UPI0003B36F96|nr:PaaI family thioesterase [Hippea alviniae]
MRNLPRYKDCFVCGKDNPAGLNITFKTDDKKVFVRTKLKKIHEGYKGRVHGGVAAALLDEAMGWSCTVITKRLYFTIELTVKYKKPISSEEELFVEAVMIKEKHNICFATATLKDKNNTVLAEAEGKYYPIPEDEENSVIKMLHHEPEDKRAVSRDDF